MKKQLLFRRYRVSLALATVGGILEAYTFVTRNGVFANAQTGNIARMGLNLAQGNILLTLRYLIPVVASNAERDTELFGRAIAILTGGTYVFLTDDSGIGDSHLEPIVGNYEVELLQDLIVRVIEEYRP